MLARDKVNLDITWMRDPDLEDGDELQAPEVIAQEIVEDLQAALGEFAALAEALQLAKAEREGRVSDEYVLKLTAGHVTAVQGRSSGIMARPSRLSAETTNRMGASLGANWSSPAPVSHPIQIPCLLFPLVVRSLIPKQQAAWDMKNTLS